MKYLEVKFHIASSEVSIASDILSALLADEGFEAFEPTPEGLMAWVQQSMFSKEGVERATSAFPLPETSIT